MNAGAYSIAATGEGATRVRGETTAVAKDAGDLGPAVGFLTGIGVSLVFWVLLVLMFV